MTFSVSEKIALELLRSALWNEPPVINFNNYISDGVWEEVYALSVSQGVQALLFDGLVKLPKALHPSGQIMLTWSVNVRMMEQKYGYYNETILELKKIFKESEIEMVLLKGVGVSSYYPIPTHREYGDIDIYLCGKQEEGDRCIQNLYGVPSIKGIKHSSFYFRKIPIENHLSFLNINRFRTFLDKDRDKIEKNLEKYLHEILENEGVEWLSLTNNEQIMIPSATFNFIFLIYHTATHFPRRIVLRHLCDWACFLYTNKGKYDEKLAEKIIRNSNLIRITSALTRLVIMYLGLPKEYAPSFCKTSEDTNLEHRILFNILRPFPMAKASYNWSGMTVWKTRRFLVEHWKYKLVFGENILERTIRSLLWWYKKRHSSETVEKFNN